MQESALILRQPFTFESVEKITIFISRRGLLCDARPVIGIHNMGTSHLDTVEITQYGGVRPPRLSVSQSVGQYGDEEGRGGGDVSEEKINCQARTELLT